MFPGDVVAKVGNTGASAGAHLHVEVFECDVEDKTKRINSNADENNELFWIDKTWNHITNRTNPFNHIKQQISK